MKDILSPFVCDNKTEFGYCRTSACISQKYNSPRSITLNRPLNNEWINIADKLPEELNYIIVYSQDNGVWMARFIDNRFYLIDRYQTRTLLYHHICDRCTTTRND